MYMVQKHRMNLDVVGDQQILSKNWRHAYSFCCFYEFWCTLYFSFKSVQDFYVKQELPVIKKQSLLFSLLVQSNWSCIRPCPVGSYRKSAVGGAY